MWLPFRVPLRTRCLHIPTLVCRIALLALALLQAPRTEAAGASEAAFGKLAWQTFLTPRSSGGALPQQRAGDGARTLEVEPQTSLLEEDFGNSRFRTVEALPTSQASRLPKDFHDCALIGSSSILKGAGRGAEIDAHKTVIRINRLPTINEMQDFGARTDVVYLNKVNSRAGNITYFGGENRSIVEGGRGLDFAAVVVKSKPMRDRHVDKTGSIWENAPFPVAVQEPGVSYVAKDMQALKGIIASSGFCAFLVFVPMCDKLTVYGFGGGSATADGHNVGDQHDFQVENALMDRLAQGEVNASEYLVEKHYLSGLYKKWIQKEFEEKRGHITIVRS